VSATIHRGSINQPADRIGKNRNIASLAFWVLFALYAAARILQVYPGKVPMLTVVALHVVAPAAFALIHGAKSYGWRGILVFVALTLAVGNLFENLGVRTGFPYGHYYFTDVMGPKLRNVPVLLGLAYVGMAYLSWTLGRVILGNVQAPLTGKRVFALPVLAASIMTAWDLSQDPVWATILHCWNWIQGGPYFGVPVSNFLGWLLTVYVFYQLFALYLQGRPRDSESLPPGHWYQALLFYGASAAGNLLLTIPRAGPTVVSDPTGRQWQASDITGTCALVTIFTMGAFAVMAWVRLADRSEYRR
jgi:uncharacterized membrane protein